VDRVCGCTPDMLLPAHAKGLCDGERRGSEIEKSSFGSRSGGVTQGKGKQVSGNVCRPRKRRSA